MGVENRKNESTATEQLKNEIEILKKQRNAVVFAHYYQAPEIQDVADFIGDSLALARIATEVDAPVIVMCGVHFMAETVKILAPEKTVLEPSPEAGCSLADSCEAGEFAEFLKLYPDHMVVSYVNTSAAVKALTDIVVTSGNAMKIVESLPADTPIVFGPDRNLGRYISDLTGRDMVLWDGACHVHEMFSPAKIAALMDEHPGAELLVHPECRPQLRIMASKVGSTAALLKYAAESKAHTFIVATERGIIHQMKKQLPEKVFIAAPADCEGCHQCGYMKMNTLCRLRDCLADLAPEVNVDPTLAAQALRPIEAMLERSRELGI